MFSRRPSLMLVLVVALVALLPLLAVLQYRWVGQVSTAERDRMKASLEASVNDFARQFDRELTRAYVDLQIDIPSLASSPVKSELATSYLSRDEVVRSYGQKYQRWLVEAKHPELVADI